MINKNKSWEKIPEKVEGRKNQENLTNETKEKVENLTNLKNRVLREINKSWIPDLNFLFSEEALKVIPEILEEFLKIETEHFNELEKKDLKDINFVDLEDKTDLDYLYSIIDYLSDVSKNDLVKNIIEDFEPKYINLTNKYQFSEKLYNTYKYILENKSNLDNDQKIFLEKKVQKFELEWINLSNKNRAKLKEINLKLSKLANDFDNNVLNSKKEFSYLITNHTDIKNLPEETKNKALENAKKSNLEWYLFDANPNSYLEIMRYCENRKIRKDFLIARTSFASSWDFDNRPLILEILKLRKEKANILWYSTFADFNLVNKMAESPKQVFDLIWWINDKSKIKAISELEELKKYFNLDKIETYDYAFYLRKIKEEKYIFDEKELKKYFKWENVLNYLIKISKNLYWIELKSIEWKKYDNNVSFFEIYKWEKLIWYYILDAFYNKNKRAWAWANNLRYENGKWWKHQLPIITNICNFEKSISWDTLINMRDATTLFHEFWHALHRLFSSSKYPILNSYNIERDFIEVPSQLNENWISSKESLVKFAKHHETWEQISDELIKKVDELKTFSNWYYLIWQNIYSLIDMILHSCNPPESIEELDKIILEIEEKNSILKSQENYKIHTCFQHIFSAWYAAWYYWYMWAEIIESDIFEKIKEMWMFEKETWEKYINTILSQWSKKPTSEIFKDFMWRELDNEAFIRKSWLI